MITLKTLEQATAQEVFDQVAKHMLSQGVQCLNKEESCMYRYGDLKCAAGCLIADDEYSEEFENSSWAHLAYTKVVPMTHMQLIREFQDIHDHTEALEWRRLLENLADEFDLEWQDKLA